jgi:cation:H+ antiporter
MDIVLAVAAVVGGLVLLEWGAERFTRAIGALARRLRASEGVVGLLTAGGEWEELVVVVLALAGGHPALAVGNVIGSCLANLLGSLPLGLLGKRPLVLDRSARVYGLAMLGVTVLASLFAFGGRVTPPEGAVLVALFVLYVASVLVVIHRGWLRPPDDDDDEDAEARAQGGPSALRPLAVLVVGLVVISGGAELVVQGAAHLAERIGLSEYAIGATVVAIGTTLPDKAISVIGGLRGQGGVVTANATGSNIFLLSLVLGLAALPGGAGLAVPPTVAHVDVPLLLAVTVLITLLFRRPSLHRRSGVALLILYVAYVVYALVQGGM